MKKLIASIMVVFMLMFSVAGCSGMKLTQGGANVANKVVDVAAVLAKGVLAGLDVIYPVLLADKAVPDFLVKATTGLQYADQAAEILHAIINGNIVGEQAQTMIAQAQNLFNQAAEVNKMLEATKITMAQNEVRQLKMKMKMAQ